jgi:hypothetical protein
VFRNHIVRIDTVSSNTNAAPLYIDRFTAQRVSDPSKLKDNESISFGVNNSLEAKVVDKKDTTKKAFKKFMILDNFGFTSSYNLRADSFNLANFGFTARTNLLKIFDINLQANFDPYYYQKMEVSTLTGRQIYKRTKYYAWNNVNSNDNRVVNLNWNPEQGIGRFTNVQLNVTARFPFKERKSRSIPSTYYGFEQQFFFNPTAPHYVDFNAKWTLNVIYTMNYSRYSSAPGNTDTRVFTNFQPGINSLFVEKSSYRNNFNFTGDFTPMTNWKIGYVTGFDINEQKMTNTNLNISRDLHCWFVTFTTAIYPTTFQYFLFTIGVKSATLSDLRIPYRSRNNPINN